MQVIKRNGSVVEFKEDKIKTALKKAFYATKTPFVEGEIDLLTSRITQKIKEFPVAIEKIQDYVEDTLLELEYNTIFQEYSTYRRKRNLSREFFSKQQHHLLKTLENLGIGSASDTDLKRENANINGDTAMGRMLQYGSTLSKEFTQAYLLDKLSSEAHTEGTIHIHDMDFYPMGTTTCLQIDLSKLFNGGFSTGHGFLREPNGIMTYAALAAIAIQSNQNDQHGGQSVPMFDYYLAEGVLKSFRKNYYSMLEDLQYMEHPFKEDDLVKIKERIYALNDLVPATFSNEQDERLQLVYERAVAKTDKETFQAMEGFIHNLNTMHSRAGAQVPFSSINFGTDTTTAGRMITKNYLLALEAGLGHGETPIFPISIFKIKDGINFNPGEVNYDLFQLACKVSAKRMFPNFSFIDAPFNLQYYDPKRPETEIAYMGCRTRVIGNVVDKNSEVVSGRGNLSFTTINLPRLGIKHGILNNDSFDKEGFFKELGEKIDLVKVQLLKRYNYQCKRKVYNFPFLMGQGNWIDSEKLEIGDTLEDILRHGTLTVGFIGLAECLKAAIGKHHGESEEAQALGLEIIRFMREKCDIYMQEYQLNFSLIATPAEGLAGRFVKIDREVFGRIEGITDREYYTNSFHVPVYYTINAAAKINKEAPYHALTNAGHISYIELDGDVTKNTGAFEKVVRMMKDAGIGYGAINHPIDRDPVCGFSGVINDKCPGCGRTEEDVPFERIRRITGYLVGTLDRFNDAKKAEEKDRVKHE